MNTVRRSANRNSSPTLRPDTPACSTSSPLPCQPDQITQFGLAITELRVPFGSSSRACALRSPEAKCGVTPTRANRSGSTHITGAIRRSRSSTVHSACRRPRVLFPRPDIATPPRTVDDEYDDRAPNAATRAPLRRRRSSSHSRRSSMRTGTITARRTGPRRQRTERVLQRDTSPYQQRRACARVDGQAKHSRDGGTQSAHSRSRPHRRDQ